METRATVDGIECSALIESIDWSKTAMGPREAWPASLRMFVPVMLASRLPMCILWGPAFIHLYNDAYAELLGPENHPAAMGVDFRERFPEAWLAIEPNVRLVYARKPIPPEQDYELHLKRLGYLEECFFTASYSPLLDDKGAVGGLLGIVTETTERVLGERRIATLRRLVAGASAAESAEQACHLAMQALADNARDVPFALLYILDADGRVVRLRDGFGLEPHEVARPLTVNLALSLEEGWPLQRAAEDRRLVTVTDLGGRFGELHGGPWPEPLTTAVILALVRQGGGLHGFLVIGLSPRHALDESYRTFLEQASQHIVAGLNHAVAYTAMRQRADASLRESEERYHALFESSPLPMFLFDIETYAFLAVNEAAVRHYGYSREEFARLTTADIRPPEDVAVFREVVQGHALRPYFGVWRHRKKDGSVIFVEVNAGQLEFDGRQARLIVINDVTARMQAEEALRSTEAQLRQSQKMDAVGRLAGGVAHDFNNVLSVILSYAQMMLEAVNPDDPLREDIGEILTAGARAADITRQLLMFSRQQVIEPKVFDLNEQLAGMEKMLRRLVGEDVELALTPAAGLGHVRGDPGSIEQVVMNLVVNARDAMPTGGKLAIATANVSLDEAYARDHLGVMPGPHVLLAVTDTGIGMAPETQVRIFEPFFTTKEKGRGTGLGLSIVFGIVQQSGGTVWVESEPGRGTTFKVYLPLVEAAVDAVKPSAAPTTLRGSETILLVEDEEQVRAVACGILKRQGYRVLEAQNGAEALLLCEKYSGTIALLLSDVVMPQMSGPELARRLGRVRPAMQILCMSGYTDDTVVRHGALDAGMAFLQKPFTPETLARKVRETLDGGPL